MVTCMTYGAAQVLRGSEGGDVRGAPLLLYVGELEKAGLNRQVWARAQRRKVC